MEKYNREFMSYAREGLAKYGGRFYDPLLPPAVISAPNVFVNNDKISKRTVSYMGGFIKIHEGSAEYKIILKHVQEFSKKHGKVRILDIGCADCALADYLLAHDIEIEYEGVDISKVDTQYKVYTYIDEIPAGTTYDFIFMLHIAEHMPYEMYLTDFQSKIPGLLSEKGTFVMATPNPVFLKGQNCDLTHVQIYPWHQAYSLLRNDFGTVNVYRCVNLIKLIHILFFPLMVFIAHLMWIDYASAVIYFSKKS